MAAKYQEDLDDKARDPTTDGGLVLAGPPILESGQMDEPPDGGTQAWINVCCSCALMFTVFGFRTYRQIGSSDVAATDDWLENGLGQLQVYYAQNQLRDYSTSAISCVSCSRGRRAALTVSDGSPRSTHSSLTLGLYLQAVTSILTAYRYSYARDRPCSSYHL
jgi:hypothetical protein